MVRYVCQLDVFVAAISMGNFLILMKLDDLLLKDSQLRALKQTSPRNYRSVFHWIWGRKPLDAGEYDFIHYSKDFVSIAENTRKDGIDGLVGACLDNWPSSTCLVRTSDFEDISLD